jgi:hypothetical protein
MTHVSLCSKVTTKLNEPFAFTFSPYYKFPATCLQEMDNAQKAYNIK